MNRSDDVFLATRAEATKDAAGDVLALLALATLQVAIARGQVARRRRAGLPAAAAAVGTVCRALAQDRPAEGVLLARRLAQLTDEVSALIEELQEARRQGEGGPTARSGHGDLPAVA